MNLSPHQKPLMSDDRISTAKALFLALEPFVKESPTMEPAELYDVPAGRQRRGAGCDGVCRGGASLQNGDDAAPPRLG